MALDRFYRTRFRAIQTFGPNDGKAEASRPCTMRAWGLNQPAHFFGKWGNVGSNGTGWGDQILCEPLSVQADNGVAHLGLAVISLQATARKLEGCSQHTFLASPRR